MPSGILPPTPPHRSFAAARIFPVCLFSILEVDLQNAVFFKHVFCFFCSPLSWELAAHGAPPLCKHESGGTVSTGQKVAVVRWTGPLHVAVLAAAVAPFPTSRDFIGQLAFRFLVIGSLTIFCVQISVAGGPLCCLKARIYRRHDPLNAPRPVQPRKGALETHELTSYGR